MPRPKFALISRRKTLEAALHIIDTEGLDALSLRRLAIELNVNPASLYHHFSNKEEILVGAAMLALSSLSSSSRYVAILYTGLIFFTQAIYGVLLLVTRDTRLSFLSFSSNLDQVGNLIFRLPLQYDTPWPVSLLMIVALVVVSAIVLERRVRGVEVVT